MSKPIGVWLKIDRESEVWLNYCSFGHYIESKNEDSFGIEDDDIMYYFKSKKELIDNFLNKDTEEFNGIVKSYELVYRNSPPRKWYNFF